MKYQIKCEWGDTLDDHIEVTDEPGNRGRGTSRNAAVGAARFMMSDEADWSQHGQPKRVRVFEYTESVAVILDSNPRPEQPGPVRSTP
jgi:hypothetical protein